MEPGRHAALRGIVFTDIVGSTELRSRLGDDRADALRRDHNALLGSAVTAHSGRVLRWTGDGIKADFPTASAALGAAIAMQRSVTAYRDRPDAVAAFEIRIGIGVGEVVVEGNEAHGIAAIEAARLEPMAAPGEILATDLVRRLGQRRTDATFAELGVFELKGLDEPVAVVRVIDSHHDDATRPLPRTLAIDGRFPMVGRTEELRRALACWQQAEVGSAALALVGGPPGLGKSRLVAHVADRAHGDGAVVLAGTCDRDLAVPYQPFAEAFTDAVALDDELAGAVAEGLGPLGPLFPARRAGGQEDAGPAARFELFQAVTGLVERLGREQPLVVALDDLQWATASTIGLLRHLLDHAATTPLLLLGTYRPDEVGPAHPLAPLLVDGGTATSVTAIELGPLGLEDVAALVSARVPFAPAPNTEAFANRLQEESAGSPFFACELLHHLATTGELEQLVDAGGALELPIPDSVRAVVGQRLARLPDEAAPLLATAAVIGTGFDLDLLAAVQEQREEEVLAACEAILRHDLLHEVGAGRFAFAHAIVRSTVLESMSSSRRALTHRRVAEAIEARGRPDHDELAFHWQAAGDEARANQNVELAARRDLDALAYESAAARYQALIDHHTGAGDAGAAAARAWLGLGLARRGLGQVDFLDAVEEAGRLGRRIGDTDLVADAAIASIWPGNFYIYARRTPADLVELAEDALARLGPDDPRRVQVLLTLAGHLTFDPDRARRVRLFAEANRLARQTNDPNLIGSALVAEYLSLWDPTTADRRAEIVVQAGRMARASGNVDHEFLTGFLGAISAAEHGRIAEARQRLDRLDEAVTAAQNFYFEFLVERFEMSLDLFTGCGEPGAVDGLAARYENTYADTAGTWAVQTGFLAMQQGRMGSLAPALATMIETSHIDGNWAAPYGLALLDVGDREGAAAVLAAFVEPPLDYFWLTTMQITAELAIGLGDDEWIDRIDEALVPHQGLLGITATGTLCYGLVATTLGWLALARGEHARAIGLLEEAVERAQAMRAPFESVKARRLLAAALLAAGRGDEAAPVIAAAAGDARRHGFDGEHRELATLAG